MSIVARPLNWMEADLLKGNENLPLILMDENKNHIQCLG